MALALNTRQQAVLEDHSRKKIYAYLQDGVEPATVNEIASEFDLKAGGVLYDLRVLVDVELVEEIPDEGFTTVEAAERERERESEAELERHEQAAEIAADWEREAEEGK